MKGPLDKQQPKGSAYNQTPERLRDVGFYTKHCSQATETESIRVQPRNDGAWWKNTDAAQSRRAPCTASASWKGCKSLALRVEQPSGWGMLSHEWGKAGSDLQDDSKHIWPRPSRCHHRVPTTSPWPRSPQCLLWDVPALVLQRWHPWVRASMGQWCSKAGGATDRRTHKRGYQHAPGSTGRSHG